ncbi:MAG: lantibiotic transport system permease protein [Oceanotoga sp.]|jgi:ABC-2 type transport system permease protein|uniref:lantibiotic immunity ABC transporter MutE/EpiE family permease subunit n=1 Tax=Oceanotoga sp. TaxID=2108366 RepID=UPI002653D396|nr:lantibiotic immunity ABC transporter MutE/EpiE family permease subunit [Oceanotoga sp.]MDN5341432.1 lantibiotic transport system permease protein [Oceanotoga sp.]
MLKYLKAENLKYKRTIIKKLIILNPIITILIALLSPIWFEINSYNFWYIIILPGTLTLMTTLVIQKEEKKLSYRAIYSLNINLKKIWITKIILIIEYLLISHIILITLIKITGYILKLPINISITQGLIASIIMIITISWQIPFSMFLYKKIKVAGTLLINFGLGFFLNILIVDSKLWFLSPYTLTSRSMAAFLKINPNGTPLQKGNPLANPISIPITIILSTLILIILTFITSNWFKTQEAK